MPPYSFPLIQKRNATRAFDNTLTCHTPWLKVRRGHAYGRGLKQPRHRTHQKIRSSFDGNQRTTSPLEKARPQPEDDSDLHRIRQTLLLADA